MEVAKGQSGRASSPAGFPFGEDKKRPDESGRLGSAALPQVCQTYRPSVGRMRRAAKITSVIAGGLSR